jgi:carboxyl-terminal processing protease
MKKFLSIYLIIILLLLSFSLGLVVGQRAELKFDATFSIQRKIQPSEEVDFDLFWKVWGIIKERYIERPVDEKKLFYGSLSGMVRSLEDPYSVYLEPEIAKKFTQELAGSFEGIGAEIGIKEGRLTIIAPLADSPAEKAGLKAGDKVYFIDDYDTTDIALDHAVSLIRGPKGTKVTLTILRDELKEPKKITIVRDIIEIKSVNWEMLNRATACQIAYLKISHFNEDTEADFKKAVLEILKKDPKGIILDLRNNPGGFLDTAIKIASYWIEEGIVVIEKRGSGNNTLPQRKDYFAQGQAFLKDLETVVLINRGSASGSEIVAGALQDHGKAVLVGEKTFGKGSVQELEELADGSAVKITVAYWLTPNGHLIEEKGITPDIEVELTEEDYQADKDPQMEKAIELISSKIPYSQCKKLEL